MTNLDTVRAAAILDHVNLVQAYTPTGPLQLRALTTLGDADTAGTEVTGGGYTGQTITMAAAVDGAAGSAADVTFDLPDCKIVGVEIWDAANVRIWQGPTSTSRSFLAGDAVTFPAGSIVTRLG